ncbi:MAG: hypothetical protein KY476_06110 [Planctomycetes bacterium]|nr:hypothetical protein [Planctomycetota bacterium]
MPSSTLKKNKFGVVGDLHIETDGTHTEQGSIVQIVGGPEDATRQQWMRLAERSGAFSFWDDPGEDIYTDDDGEPI